jgi:UDP-glucose 4-epimerase
LNRIIVTGGNGFIGKHLVKKLLSTNEYSVTVISNRATDDSDFLSAESHSNDKLRLYVANILDENSISEIIRNEAANTCIHLAAKTSVPDSIKNPEETMKVNVKGTLNVLEACRSSNVSNFIFASSAAVYGDVTDLPISEDVELNPLSPYGESKMLAEQHVLRYGESRMIQNAISLRIFNAYGVGQTSASDVVTKFAKRVAKGLAPIISGDGTNTRDFISVDDVTEAMLLSLGAIKNNHNYKFDVQSSIFNIGSGAPLSIRDLALKMISIEGLDVNPIYQKDSGLGVILHSYADISKAKKHLQFSASKGLDVGLKEVIEHERR